MVTFARGVQGFTDTGCHHRSFQAAGVPNISLAVLRAAEAHQMWLLLNGGPESGLRQGFVPHLTIVRDARAPLGRTAIDPLAWDIDGFALVESRPGRPYEILQRWEAA